jgi:hypothetical protein
MFRATRKEAHDWHPGLQGTRRERPRHGRTIEQRDEVAAVHLLVGALRRSW